MKYTHMRKGPKVLVVGKNADYTTFRLPNGHEFKKATPGGKARKYCAELQESRVVTLDGEPTNIPLNARQKAFRAGYCQSRQDQAACWRHAHPKH
jgi:hypothetical protein